MIIFFFLHSLGSGDLDEVLRMLLGIEKHVNRLKEHLHLNDSDIVGDNKAKGGSVNKGYLKLVITAWLKPKNKYEPSWRKLAQAVGSIYERRMW